MSDSLQGILKEGLEARQTRAVTLVMFASHSLLGLISLKGTWNTLPRTGIESVWGHETAMLFGLCVGVGLLGALYVRRWQTGAFFLYAIHEFLAAYAFFVSSPPLYTLTALNFVFGMCALVLSVGARYSNLDSKGELGLHV